MRGQAGTRGRGFWGRRNRIQAGGAGPFGGRAVLRPTGEKGTQRPLDQGRAVSGFQPPLLLTRKLTTHTCDCSASCGNVRGRGASIFSQAKICTVLKLPVFRRLPDLQQETDCQSQDLA